MTVPRDEHSASACRLTEREAVDGLFTTWEVGL